MAEEDIARLTYDLRRLEARVANIQHRVSVLEGSREPNRAWEGTPTPSATPVVPIQPVKHEPPKPAAVPPPLAFDVPIRPVAPPPVPVALRMPAGQPARQAPKPAADTEYRIGAVILPRVGAVVVLAGIGFFVSMAISRGWIDQWTQFWMGVTTCLAFIGVGVWKRNEQEEFGQILIGIGSCGLYLAFTAGHVFLHRYDRATLVGLFLGLSLLNLWYSYLVSSRSFLAIGLICGLAAATMPITEHRVALNVVLHLAIVLPSAIIVARNRWSGWAPALWALSMIALVPALLEPNAWQLRVAALYLSSLICSAAYVAAGEWIFDPQAVFAPAALLASALVGLFWVRGGNYGVAHVCILGAAIGALGRLLPSDGPSRGRMALAAVAIPAMVAPWGLPFWSAAFVFQALGIVSVFVGVRSVPRVGVALGWVLFALGATSYLIAVSLGVPVAWGEEALLLGLMIAAALTGAWGVCRVVGSPEWVALGAGILALPIFTRLAFVALSLSPAGVGMYASLLMGWMVFSFFVNVLSARSRMLVPLIASWLTLLLALGFYVAMAENEPLRSGADALMVLGLIATTAITTHVARGFADREQAETLVLAAALLILPLFSRVAWVVAAPAGVDGMAALVLAWMLYSLGLSALTAWKRWTSICGASWLVLILAMCGYVPLAAAGTLTRLQDVATILGLIGVAFAAAWTTRLVDEVRPVEVLVNAAACLVLPAFSRLAYLLLAPAGLDAGTTLAMGWMAYSVAAGALALKLRWNGTAALAGGVALLAAAAYGLQIAKKVPPFGIELPLVLALLGTLGFAAFTLGRCGSLGESVSGMFTTAAFIVLPVFTRLAWLCLTHWGVSTVGALVFGWVAYSLAASAVARVNGWTEPVWIAWSCVALTWVAYGSQFVDQGFARSEELWLLTFMLASILAATLAGSRRAEDPASVVAVAVLACWALFTRLVVVGLADPTFGMRVSAAVTLAWSAYALILMSWGFARRFRLLRYWSLAVFGCTLVKVVLVDMAALDAALRVGVLMVLGVAMLGVGYWYVRNKGLLNADGGPKASA